MAGPVEQGSARSQNRKDLSGDENTKMGAVPGKEVGSPGHSLQWVSSRASAAGDSEHCEEDVSEQMKRQL